MVSKNTSDQPIGVLGAGSFGSTIANMLAERNKVFLYDRRPERVEVLNKTRLFKDKPLHKNITITNHVQEVASECNVIFPIVSSSGFRDLMIHSAQYLRPYHILIHGTKGLSIDLPTSLLKNENSPVSREHVKTMSEVITEETSVVRVGCLAGPNLASELAEGQPGATVIASPFNEVINVGISLLRSERFQVYGNKDLIGIELAGVLKNIIAIASGALKGLGLGENARALLISRGMIEMIYLGRAMGGHLHAFLGLAGVGDLVATCSSELSRNFTVGYRLAQGETLQDIVASMEEVAEGVNTVKIIKRCADFYRVKAPLTQALHKILFRNFAVQDALKYLMSMNLQADIDFLPEDL